jgi:hypothetical protein
VLRPEGRFVVVEPWSTPFLSFVHAVARQPMARRLSSKLDAFQTMTEREATTYFAWLRAQREILAVLAEHFRPVRQSFAWGKLLFVGSPRPF